jgi:REP element-mobilizing transposase RayT
MTKSPHRRSIRLKGHDYSWEGAYYITLCTYHRKCLFGRIIDNEMNLNEIGNIVADEWTKTAGIREEIKLDAWVVMPNHIHAIVFIANPACIDSPASPPSGPRPKSISAMVAGYKSAATTRVNRLRGTPGAKLWHRNYWDRIITDEKDLNRVRQYIRDNPTRWATDRFSVPN